jgi:hypothetical protein
MHKQWGGWLLGARQQWLVGHPAVSAGPAGGWEVGPLLCLEQGWARVSAHEGILLVACSSCSLACVLVRV